VNVRIRCDDFKFVGDVARASIWCYTQRWSNIYNVYMHAFPNGAGTSKYSGNLRTQLALLSGIGMCILSRADACVSA
jgi:hypothetical protein